MLEQIPKDDLQRFYDVLRSATFWAQMGKDAVAFKNLVYTATSDVSLNAFFTEIESYQETYPQQHV